MAEIVNLRRARKARAQAEKEAQAAANRARFGAPKAERRLRDAQKDLTGKQLDGHRLDDPAPDPPAKA